MNFFVKLIGALLLLLSATVFGFYLSNRLRLRRDFMLAFAAFLTNLETNIRYTPDNIITLVKRSAPNYLSDVFCTESQIFSEYWAESVEKIPKSYGLKADDYALLSEFGKLLGTTDIEGQLKHIELYKTLFNNSLDNSNIEYKNKGKLYRLLGFFCGAVLSIMFI